MPNPAPLSRPAIRVGRSFSQAILALLILLVPALALAKPASGDQARRAVQGWLDRDHRPMGQPISDAIGGIETVRDAGGEALYHVVRLAPAGYVVVAADDLIEPIIAFSAEGQYDPSSANPLIRLLQRDLPARHQHVKAREAEAAGRGRQLIPTGALAEARERWQKLTVTATDPALAYSLTGISDVRVAPLMQSRWDQETVAGKACYNYYTPTGAAGMASNYPVGCVATAMAQLMRFYQYPTTGVGTGAFTIYVNGAPKTATLRGGNGAGGAYAWASMPLVPNSTITTAQCQAIGALCYDSAVSVNMQFAADGSGASPATQKRVLLSTFKYANAVFGAAADGTMLPAGFSAMANPNLDAGYPVLLGIYGSSGGHDIVCDGYGYSSATPYHHLNLGWGGASDAWYNLPTISTPYASFNEVGYCTYNIYPGGAGEILSGRITTSAGAPLAGVTVTAARSGGGSYSALTNANGIYALRKIPSSSTYTVSAAKSGYAFGAARTVGVGKSADWAATAGNVWGINFSGTAGTPTPTPTPTPKPTATPTPTPTPIPSVTPTPTPVPGWTLATGAAPWPARYGHSLVVFGNHLTLLGGTPADNSIAFSYNGSTWNRYATNGPLSRSWMGVVVFNNRLWLTGGLDNYGNVRRDVWSSADGINWTQVNAAPPWPARYAHCALAFGGKLYVIGGTDVYYNMLRDVWSSTDGVTWTRVTATAGWDGLTNFAAYNFAGRIWVVGDGLSGTEAWMSDTGATWTKIVTIAGLGRRYCFGSTLYKGYMYVIGGYDYADTTGNPLRRDVWSSGDGIHWVKSSLAVPWSARYGMAAAAYGGKLWLTGGNPSATTSAPTHDVWAFTN